MAARRAGLFAVGCVAWSLPWWQAMLAGSVVVGAGLPWTLVAAVTAVQGLRILVALDHLQAAVLRTKIAGLHDQDTAALR